MPDDIYCIDTSSIIELNRYPRGLFPGVWRELGKLIEIGRLIAPREVRREIMIGTDELVSWAKRNRKMFRKFDQTQKKIVDSIMAKFSDRFDLEKETPEADPFVVALAIATRESGLFAKCIVVTDEGKNKLSFVCRHYGIESIKILQLFEREGWQFG